VVVNDALSYLDAYPFPSKNVVEDAPGVVGIRLFEISINCDVLIGVFSHHSDIIDGQPEGIRVTCSFKLQ